MAGRSSPVTMGGWSRTSVVASRVILELTQRGVRCECRQPGCTCVSDADVVRSDGSRVCACCLVDCPDVHEDADPAEGAGGALA